MTAREPHEPLNEPLSGEERELQRALDVAPPEPRRSDAAFARAVRADVGQRRRPAYVLPAAFAAVACGALLVVTQLPGVDDAVPPPGASAPADLLASTLDALAEDDALAGDDDALVAVADEGYDAFWENDTETDDDELDFAGDAELPEDAESLLALNTLLDEAIAERLR